MKNASHVVITLFLGVACVVNTRADNSPAGQTPTANEIMQLQDPDGVPLEISHPKPRPPSPSEVAAAQKQAAADLKDQDWLLRGYEQQLQQRASRQGGTQSNNLYLRLASDKGLSQLAGVSSIDPNPDSTSTALRTGTGPTASPTLGLRPDPTMTPKPGAIGASKSLLAPLITPLGSAEAAGLHNFYGSSQPTTPAPKIDAEKNSADLDMPGKVAAENDPMAKASLTFDTYSQDALPSKDPANGPNSGILPISTNAEHLQRMNDAAMLAPGTTKSTAPVNNLTTLQLNLTNQDPPAKLAPPSPVRQPIVNPYSILDH